MVEEIQGKGGRAIAIQADVGNYDQVKSMVERSIEEFGKVDILVNNAGIAGPYGPMADITPEEFEGVINNHLVGSFNTAHCLLHHMREQERGDIIFISSRQTDFFPPNSSPYNAAKAGMDGMAQGLAKEERYNGIRVNVVAPGLVPTDILMEELMADYGQVQRRRGGQGDALRADDAARGHREPVHVPRVRAGESHLGRGDICAGCGGGRATLILRERAEALLLLYSVYQGNEEHETQE